jgi:hypothetical protein
MKFTKEDARKELMSKIPNKGQTLNLSERSINEMLETLMPLVANDETELDDFVTNVLPTFKTADGNVRHEVSAGINKYKEENPIVQQQILQNEEDEATKALKAQIEALQKRLDDDDKAKKDASTRKDFISKVKEKGVKDSDWIKDYVSELTIGDDFDLEARVNTCVKLYNKGKAATGKDVTNPEGAGGDGDDSDKAITNTIAAAAAIAQQRRPQ